MVCSAGVAEWCVQVQVKRGRVAITAGARLAGECAKRGMPPLDPTSHTAVAQSLLLLLLGALAQSG